MIGFWCKLCGCASAESVVTSIGISSGAFIDLGLQAVKNQRSIHMHDDSFVVAHIERAPGLQVLQFSGDQTYKNEAW